MGLVGLGVLHDHRLAFPRHSHGWGGGVASVQLQHSAEVWGIVYQLSESDVAALDRYEGFHTPGDPHNAYEREGVYIDLKRPDDGSFPRRVRALLYVAVPANPTPPSKRYLEGILRGARHHRLPDDYIAALAKTVTVD